MLVFLDDITIRLGDRPVFESTTWRIERGQHWGVSGPSGSGKTILTKALAGRLPLMRGQIRYFFDGRAEAGRSYLYPSEILTFSGETHRQFQARYAAYHQARWQSFEGQDVPTVSGLLEGASARSPFEITSPAHPGGGKMFEHGALVDLLGLAPLLNRQVHQLSHGESRKVFLARLLLRSPRLLILDDPFTGLDVDTRSRLQASVNWLLEQAELSILFIGSRLDDLPAGITHYLLTGSLKVVQQGPAAGLGRRANLAPGPLPSALAAGGRPAQSPAVAGVLARYAGALKSDHPAQSELVRITGASVCYDDVTVLDNIHWTVRAGERWALQGPNGAGKTTLLSLILADNPQAYRSEIVLFGQKRGSGESIWEIKRQTGWVSPELHAFYNHTDSLGKVVLSGFYDSVGLHRLPTPAQRSQAGEWLAALGLQSHRDTPFSALAAGQQRLALLARALVKQPPLLILDEPCQGLDERQRGLFLGFIEQLCAQTPLALIYVTHEQEELPRVITHTLRLARGKVVYQSG